MKKYEWRAFTSLFILLSFLIIVVSGLVLFIAPPGRIANWTSVPLLGLEKEQWQTIHTVFTFLFVIAGIFHIYFNWNILISHLRGRFSKKYFRRKEILFSVAATVIIFTICMTKLPPASTIMAFGDSVKDSWENEDQNPPVPHAEEMTLSEIAVLVNEEPDSLLHRLKLSNLSVSDTSTTLADLAKNSHHSPKQIFDLVHRNQTANPIEKTRYSGRGRGRKTLKEICREEQINPDIAIENLKSAGIRADQNSRLRDLATSQNLKPSDIIDLMKK